MSNEHWKDQLQWDSSGLLPVVVQSRHGGEVRMVAYANELALERTLATGLAHFWSRSRQSLWQKGETSGNTIRVHEVWTDCDCDCLLYMSDPQGPTCHTGRESCFFRLLQGAELVDPSDEELLPRAAPTLVRLFETLERRRDASGSKSYTKSLLDGGPEKIGAKIREEAGELVDALLSETDDRVASEAGDVLYHMLVGLLARGLTLSDVEDRLANRFGQSGHAEKASRSS